MKTKTKKEEYFEGRYCTLVVKSEFVLSGLVFDCDDNGFMFSTNTKTSYISWDDVKSLKVVDEHD